MAKGNRLQLDDDDLVKQIFDSLTEQGVDRDRLEVLGPMPSTFDHLNTYNEADIGLDTFPYNGTTTTCEAAWMGVPVITTIGEVHSARVGASLNTALGLEELIAKDPEEYVEKAVALATDVPRLRALQNGLRGRMENSVLRNDALYAERFGAAIEQIWEQHLAKNEGLVSSV
ncbi:MAG: hypothetical protein KI792_14480 [Alphaproteobacteria bacterium]|nr:hypothetical protein [Alphaproteobacteria bacterium SS10]